jgi:CRISPR-associated protein Csx17
MSESDRTIDWSKTTFEGSRREQLRRWRALTLRQRLEALDRLSDLAGPFEQQKTGQETTAGPPQDLHEGAVREPPTGYDKTADHGLEPAGPAPKPRDPTRKQRGK